MRRVRTVLLAAAAVLAAPAAAAVGAAPASAAVTTTYAYGGNGPFGQIVVNPANATVYGANNAAQLFSYAGTADAGNVTLPGAAYGNPDGMAVDTANGDVWVANVLNVTKSVSPFSSVTAYTTPAHATDVAIDSTNGTVWVADGTVTELAESSGAQLANYTVGAGGVFAVAVDPTTAEVWALSTTDLYEIPEAGGTAVTVPLPTALGQSLPSDLAFNQTTDTAYVGSYSYSSPSTNVYAVDGSTDALTVVPSGLPSTGVDGLTGVAVDTATNQAFAIANGDTEVGVINGTATGTPVNLPSTSVYGSLIYQDVAVNPTTGVVYASSGASNAQAVLVMVAGAVTAGGGGSGGSGFAPPTTCSGCGEPPPTVTTNPGTGGTNPQPGGGIFIGSPLPPIDAPWWTVSNSETGVAGVNYTWWFALDNAATGVTSIEFQLPSGTSGTPGVAQCYGIDCSGATVAMGTGSSADVATLTVASQTVGTKVPVEIVLSGLTNTATAGDYATTVTVYSGATADAQSPSEAWQFGSSTTQVNVAVPDSATFTDSAPDIYVTPIPGSGVAYAACGTGATTTGDPATATGSAPCPVNLSVSTNSGSGFTISASATALKTSSGYTLAEGNTAGSSAFAEDTFAAEAQVTAGSATTTSPWGSSTWVGYGTSPTQIASAGAATGSNTVTVAVTNAAEVDFAQAAGDYHGTITYSLTPGY